MCERTLWGDAAGEAVAKKTDKKETLLEWKQHISDGVTFPDLPLMKDIKGMAQKKRGRMELQSDRALSNRGNYSLLNTGRFYFHSPST